MFVIVRKENLPGEAQVRISQRKAYCRREKDSWEKLHEEADVQRKTLRRGENFGFNESSCLEK